MAIDSERGTGPAEVLGQLGGQLASLGEVLWSARNDDELVDVVAHVAQLRAMLTGLEARAVAEVDARGIAKSHLGWSSTGDWLTHLGGLRRGHGRRVVRRARALVAERTDLLAALSDGTVSPDQAEVIVEAVDQLPGSPFLRRRGERHLLSQAMHFDATDLGRAGRHLVHVIDPDRAERRLEAALDREERAAHTGRFLAISDDGAGGVRLKGRGSVEDGAILRATLLPLTAPRPSAETEAAPTGLQAHEEPDSPGRDRRDHGARAWDALVTTAQHSLDTELPHASHGARPRVAVMLDLDSLAAGLGRGVTDDGLELSAATIRRLACDATIIPVVLGGPSAVLDVGREQRLVTPAMWNALVARDRHCAFPGCTRPPVMCHAHHVTHWSQGGSTALDNLVLLCGHHHRTIHHTPWEVRLARDGLPEFTPPARPGQSPPLPLRHRPRRE
jgi:Domain of unknown function (DUF222)/HNH endonuclease